MKEQVVSLTLHNDCSETVLAVDVARWVEEQSPWRLFNTAGYSWNVEGKEIYFLKKNLNLYLLPDASGFICIENSHVPNNCTLLDAHGQERLRLTVPWQLATLNSHASDAPPAYFVSTSTPYLNPADGQPGQFGVKAWVEFGGEYYFELDWRTGEFLWGREIRF